MARNNFVFTDANAPGGFSPEQIVATDAGAGIKSLQDLYPNLDYAAWGGTLFAQTTLNDPTYIQDYDINLTPGSTDCTAILNGFVSGAATTLYDSYQYPVQFLQAIPGLATGGDTSILAACVAHLPFNQQGVYINQYGQLTSQSVTLAAGGSSDATYTYNSAGQLTTAAIDAQAAPSGPAITTTMAIDPAAGTPTSMAIVADSSTGAAEGSAQIDLATSANPTTTITATNENGLSETLNVSGTPIVVTDGTGTTYDEPIPTGPAILVASDNATMSDTSSGNVFLLLGNNASITAGNDAQVVADGDDSAINAGASSDLALNGNNDSATLTDATVNLTAGTGSNISGNDNSVNLNLGDAVGVSGGGNDITGVSAGDLLVLSNTGSALDTVSNAFGDVSGGTTAGGGTGIIVSTAASAYITGVGDSISIAGGSVADMSATNFAVFDASATAVFAANSSATITGGDAQVYLSVDDSATVTSGGGDLINGTAGDMLAISGTGGVADGVTASNDGPLNSINYGITVAGNAQVNINGSDDTVTLAGGDDFGIGGGGNTVDAVADDFVVLSGTGSNLDLVNVSGDSGGYTALGSPGGIYLDPGAETNVTGGNDYVSLLGNNYLGVCGGSGYTVDASGDSIATTPDTSFSLESGGDNVWLSTSSSVDLLNGLGYTVYAGNDTITAGADTSVNVADGGDTVTLGTDSSAYLLGGTNYTVYATNDTISTSADTTFNVANGGDTVNLGSASYVGLLGGAGYTVNAAGDTVATWSDTGFNLQGGNDTVDLGGASYLGLIGGSGYSVNATYCTIATTANTSFNLADGGDTVNLATGDYLGLLGGSGYSVNATYCTIATTANTSFNLADGSDTVNLGASTYLGLLGGSGYAVSGTGDTIATWADTSFNLAGSNDSINLGGTGSYLGLLGGSGLAVSAGGDTINTWANTYFSITGNSDSVGAQSGDQLQISGSYENVTGTTSEHWNALGQDNVLVTGAYSVVQIGAGDNGDVVYASGDNLVISAYDTMTIVGNNDKISGSYDNFTIYGNNDPTVGNDNTATSSGSDDFTDGSGNADHGTEYVEESLGGFGGYYGYYALTSAKAATSSTRIAAIAQYDTAQGYTKAADAAQTAIGQAAAAVAGAFATSAATLARQPASAFWTDPTITWSFAAGPSGGASPLSGAIGAQEQPIIEAALQAWSAASGLTFQQVGAGAAADITIGWADLDTSASSVVGYTTQNRSGTWLLPGTQVALEDPAETALSADAAGDLTYANTDVTLYQDALHEIGHALGLADDSDPNSVMYAALGPANTTLDSTDVAAIQLLYGPSGTASVFMPDPAFITQQVAASAALAQSSLAASTQVH